MVLAQAKTCHEHMVLFTYEKDPVLYMYQLLDDCKDGNLCILPDFSDSPPTEREPEVICNLVGQQVE